MWLYPIPAVLAFLGFLYLLFMRPKSIESIRVALALVIVGTVIYAIRRATSAPLDPPRVTTP